MSKTSRVALGGILTAVALVLLYLAAIAPSGRFALTAIAGLSPTFAVMLVGQNLAYLVWGASSILGLILMPDKAVALLFALIFGLYPVLKSFFERQKNRVVEWLCKLSFALVGLLVLRYVLLHLLLQELPSWLNGQEFLVFPVGIVVFIAYDIALSRLIALLIERVVKRK